MRGVWGLTLVMLVLQHGRSQEVYHNCGMEGDATSVVVRQLNRLKNRYVAPRADQIDSTATLGDILEPGNDEARWTDTVGAEIVGYVLDVKKGGTETCNCHSTNPQYRDTHIELILNPAHQQPVKRVIVEVTPRWRAIMKQQGIDWSTAALQKALTGHWVRVRGWLLFDLEHAGEAENTNPHGRANWRATAWEIHPITALEVVTKPK